jgi:ribosomal protein L7/L12
LQEELGCLLLARPLQLRTRRWRNSTRVLRPRWETLARIAVLKAVTSVTSLGVKEAEDLLHCSSFPKEGHSQRRLGVFEANKTLEAAAAKCSVK